MIHLCYGLYDQDGHYSKFCGTSIASVFENTTQKVVIHILHDNTLTTDNRDKFVYLAGKYNQQIIFYNVEVLAADKINMIRSALPGYFQARYSVAALYRLLIPNLIKTAARIIYLDADILVHRDIADLWNMDLANRPLAAMPEFASGIRFSIDKYLITSGLVAGDDYFNIGVLLIDLNYLREHEYEIWKKGFEFVGSHPECRYFDQDVLNYCFAINYTKLTPEFNRFIDVERIYHKPCVVKKSFYHFLSNSLKSDLNDCFNRLYFEYFAKTPWFNIDAFNNVFNAIDNIQKMQQINLLNMIKLLAKRERAFMTEANNFPALKAVFDISDDEILIDAIQPDALNRVINTLRDKDNKRPKVLFIFSGNYLGFRNFLIGQQFVEGVDFINALTFFSSMLGIPYDSHPIVRAM